MELAGQFPGRCPGTEGRVSKSDGAGEKFWTFFGANIRIDELFGSEEDGDNIEKEKIDEIDQKR